MNLLIFHNPYVFFQFFLAFLKILFLKKNEALNVQLLVQSPEKNLFVIWNLLTKTYPNFVTKRSYFKILKKTFKHVEFFFKIYMDSIVNQYLFDVKKE